MYSYDAILINGNFCMDFGLGKKKKSSSFMALAHPHLHLKDMSGVKQKVFAGVYDQISVLNHLTNRSTCKILCLQHCMCQKKIKKKKYISKQKLLIR